MLGIIHLDNLYISMKSKLFYVTKMEFKSVNFLTENFDFVCYLDTRALTFFI